MKTRLFIPALILGLTACLGDSAEAQRDRRRIPRGDIFGRQSRVNPAHEESKRQADQAYQQGDYQRAERLTSNVLSENAEDSVAYYLRASARVEMGLQGREATQIRRAIADARNAIRYDTDTNYLYYIPYLYGMTSLAAVENRPDHAEVAVEVADDVLARRDLENQERSQLLYQRGRAHSQLGNSQEAISDYREVVRANRTHLGAHLALADAYDAAGEFERARDRFDRAVRAFPDNPVVYNNRGMFLQRRDEIDRAVADFTRALELDTRYFYAYTNRGFALMSSGDPEAAEADYSRSLEINPQQPNVYGMRSAAHLAQGDVSAAVGDQLRAVRLAPQDASAHANLGFARFFAGDYGSAVTSFERALSLNPEMRHLRNWEALALELSGQKEQAMAMLGSAREQAGRSADWVRFLMDYLAGEIDAGGLIDSVHPDDESVRQAQLCEAHCFIGLRERNEGNLDAAREHFEQAVETKQPHLSAYRGATLALREMN